MERTARQLEGRHLRLFGEYLWSWKTLNVRYRRWTLHRWIDGGKHVLAMFLRTVPTIVTAHIFCACESSRARRERNAQHAGHAYWFFSPVSLGGSSYFLWKRCVVFQQMKNNFYLPCQFFENQRSMRMLLFLPYDRSDRTFHSQTKVELSDPVSCPSEESWLYIWLHMYWTHCSRECGKFTAWFP